MLGLSEDLGPAAFGEGLVINKAPILCADAGAGDGEAEPPTEGTAQFAAA